jgi:small multidrug resistance pump
MITEATMQSWFLLIAAIVAEVGGTTCLKLSDGFSRLIPSLGVGVLYLLSFFFLATVLKTIDVGVAYAIWSGLGTAIVVVIGIMFFGEPLSAARLVSVGFIIVGIMGLQLTGGVH